MSEPMFLTLNEVIERYRGQIGDGTCVIGVRWESDLHFCKSARPFATRLRNSIDGSAEISSFADPSDHS
jgi:hypothetical protein